MPKGKSIVSAPLDEDLDWSKIGAVYADGGLIGRNGKNRGGTWAFCYVDTQDHRFGNRVYHQSGILLPESETDIIENNMVETYALLRALHLVPTGWVGVVYSDNKNALGRVFWGYKATNIPPHWFKYSLEGKDVKQWEPVLLGGHPTKDDQKLWMRASKKPVLPCSPHNVFCDKMCNQRRAEYEAEFPIERGC